MGTASGSSRRHGEMMHETGLGKKEVGFAQTADSNSEINAADYTLAGAESRSAATDLPVLVMRSPAGTA